jgi:YVTN family beta-propeller protein
MAAIGDRLYVSNYGHTVSVIDIPTNSVVETVAVGGSPAGLAVSGNHLYLTNSNDGTLSVITTVHNGPELAPNDDGTFDLNLNYGTPGEFSNVEIPETGQPGAPQYWTVKEQHYDPETGKLVVVLEPTIAAQLLAGQHVPLNDSFTVQATPATQAAATFSTFSFRTAGAALAAADAQGTSTPLPQPPGASFVVTEDAVDVDGKPAGTVVTNKFAYVLNYEDVGGVTVIGADPTSPTYNTIITMLPTGSSPALATLAGDRLYVVGSGVFSGVQGPATVTVINTNTNTVVDNFDIERYSFTPTATPQGDRIYVTNILNGGLYVIDSDPSSPTYNTVLDMDPSTTDIIDPIHVVSADAQPGTAQITAGTFNADGTRLYVALDRFASDQSGTEITGDVIVIDTDPTSATYNQVLDVDPATPEIDYIHAPSYIGGFGTTANGHLYEPGFDLVGAQQNPDDIPPSIVSVIDVDPDSPTYHTIIDVDPTTPEVDGITVGSYALNMAASPDGSVVYVINVADGTVTAIDTVTNRVITTFVYDTTPVDVANPADAGPNLLAMSPDGKQLYITKYSDGTVTAVSIVPTDPGVV